MTNSTTLYGLCVLVACTFLTACSIPKPVHFYREANAQQLQKHRLQAGKFPLIYYSRAHPVKGDTLHVYLGGDGVPWHHHIIISEDPGPYSPLVLQLMKQDPSPSVFVGRPCYQGLARLAPCQPRYWTSARYADELVESMRRAILTILDRHAYQHLVLIGYSGGGTLAVLLADKLAQTKAVLTLAANLDIDAWTRLHNYTPLSESLNPADSPALDERIKQIHIQGGRDQNIPPEVTRAFVDKQKAPLVIRVADADHSCCWVSLWPQILYQLDRILK